MPVVLRLCAAARASTTRTPVSVATGAHKSPTSPSRNTPMRLLYNTLPMATMRPFGLRFDGSSQFLMPINILAFTMMASSGSESKSTTSPMAASSRPYSSLMASTAVGSAKASIGSKSFTMYAACRPITSSTSVRLAS